MPTGPPPLPWPARVPVAREVVLLGWGRGWWPSPGGRRSGRVAASVLVGDAADHTHRKMLAGSYEPSLLALARQLLRPGDVVVDVGAHIGWFSVLAAGLVGSSGVVHAFEPFPPSYALLEGNVAALPQVHAVHTAVGAAPGTLRLAPQPGSDSGSVSAAAAGAPGAVEVPVEPLDRLLANDPAAVRLLKVDVEGYEPEVLDGATQVLDRTELVLYEVNRPALAALGSDEQDLRRTLERAGFGHQEQVRERGLRRLKGRQDVVNVLARRGPGPGGRAGRP